MTERCYCLGTLIPCRGKSLSVREGDRLYGRGAVDAKGPLCTFVSAAQAAAERMQRESTDGAVGLRIVVVGAVEEDRRPRGARHILAQHRAPDCVVIGEPSGWDRMMATRAVC